MTAAQGTAVKAVSDAQSTATQAVQTAQTDAVSAVEKAGSKVLESIPEDYQTTVKKVEELKTEKAEIDDTTVGADAWSSKHIVDMLCPPISETGNPVQCYPVAGYPLGVKAKWEPMQEGSGTPYPAGGGKNLWGDLLQDTFVSQQGLSSGYSGAKTTGKIPCTEGDNYTLSCATTFAPAPGNIGVLAYFDASDTMLTRIANTYQRAFTLTAPANAAYLRASCYQETDADNVQLEKGSVATAYAPYENIRPIKGRDSVTVERCGENLLNPEENDHITYTPYGLTTTYIGDNKVHLSGTYQEDGGSFAILDTRQKLLAGKGLKITGFTIAGTKQSYTLYGLRTKNETVIAMQTQFSKGDVIDMTVAVVVSGSRVPTTYAPYTGQTATLTLPRTIYGGTVDAVTGEGNENTKIITLDGNELKFTKFDIYINLPDHSAPGILERGIICCSHFNRTLFGVNTNYEFCFLLKSDMDGLFANIDDLNAYLAAQYAAGTPVQIAYKLAEPTPFTATGAQPIPALSGVNTVLTDADSATVIGRADPIKRIIDLEDAVASMT